MSRTSAFLRGKMAERRIYPRVREALRFLFQRGDLVGSAAHRASIQSQVRHGYLDREIRALEADLEASRRTVLEVAVGFVAWTREKAGEDCLLCGGRGEYEKRGNVIIKLKDPATLDPKAAKTYNHKRAILWCVKCMGTGWLPKGSQDA
jgi:hypothetical protein